jgi:hypothetical protein
MNFPDLLFSSISRPQESRPLAARGEGTIPMRPKGSGDAGASDSMTPTGLCPVGTWLSPGLGKKESSEKQLGSVNE